MLNLDEFWSEFHEYVQKMLKFAIIAQILRYLAKTPEKIQEKVHFFISISLKHEKKIVIFFFA